MWLGRGRGGGLGEVRVLGEVLMDAWGHGEEEGQTVIFVEDEEGEEPAAPPPPVVRRTIDAPLLT